MNNSEPLRYNITVKGPYTVDKVDLEQKFAKINEVLAKYPQVKVIQKFNQLYTVLATSTKEEFEKLFEVMLNYESEYPESPSKLAQQILNWKIQGETGKARFRVPKEKAPKDLEEIAIVEIERKEYLGGR